MSSPLVMALANAFLVYVEKKFDFKSYSYRWCVDDIFVLFTSTEHIGDFQNFLNAWHANISFTIESQKQNRMYLLEVQIN